MNDFILEYTEDFKKDLEEICNYIKFHLKNLSAANALLDEIEKSILERLEFADSFKTIHTKIKTKYPLYSIKVKRFYVIYAIVENKGKKIMEVRNLIYAGRSFFL